MKILSQLTPLLLAVVLFFSCSKSALIEPSAVTEDSTTMHVIHASTRTDTMDLFADGKFLASLP